ncbi:MAG: Response regulatory protein [Gammaproteobacteria bacterium]|nr:Response regulatory protein [Gammaproteobacteria bacterium]
MGSENTPRRILIIDDDADYRKLLHTWLLSLFPVTDIVEYDPLNQGLPAPDFNWTAIDVLLLDYDLRLPDATGLDLLHLNQDNQLFPATMMLTSAGSEGVAVRAMKYGVTDYLPKDQVNKEILKTAVENAFAQHNLKRQRLSLLDEMREVARQESTKLMDDYKDKLSTMRALEEKRLQQERQKIARELEHSKQHLAKLEDEQKQAEHSRQALLDEIDKLKQKQAAAMDKPKLNERLEKTEVRYGRISAESKRLQTNLKQAVDKVDKNQWQLELSKTMEIELAKEVADFKVETERKAWMEAQGGITLLRRAHAQQSDAKQKKAEVKQQNEQLLNDIASQLHKEK